MWVTCLQLVIAAIITMTVFFRTRLKANLIDANYYLGSLFFSILILLVDGFPELSMTVARLQVFYKQRDICFYPAWAYAIPASVLKIPMSLLASTVWTCLTYYVIGYSPEPGRFFRQLLLLCATHFTSVSMFRFIASVFQTVDAAITMGSIAILILLSFGGFIIPHSKFLMTSTNTTIGLQTLESRGLDFEEYYYWISLCAMFGFALLFNIGFVVALSYFKAPGTRAIISKEKLSQVQGGEGPKQHEHKSKTTQKAVSDPHQDVGSGAVTIEFPYLLALSLLFVCITYPMIGYYWSAYKVFCYFYTFLCTLMYFTYLGMMLVAMTPSFPVAAILQAQFYTMFNLFGGFLIPKPKIPNWWIWMYYLTPTSWSLNALLTSQYGDVKKEILVFGETKSVESFIRDYFGYHHDQLPLVFVLLALYPIVLASLFAYFVAKLNFQKR
ncbi:putative ABC-2 type transporter, plant PDR ABC transporter associated [Helianthus annuus]|nr:putative ABC-2 type transporter, plant PDR ABC transporter associated [Helianthus annuus]